ncbi:MAG TPA: hypothetical protein PK926_11935 [Spirochaetota bacterium]|nr:hypothetical protein [Spirochaetota bacterium]HPI88221.1 hypothetical protein [Spirochaetota bacterium]HPR47235.1 hypothetical protein [Spirochaetota bacterium]
MEEAIRWTFPENIKFEEVSDYLDRFKHIDASQKIIFDLTDTINIHSSFIGFMINAKHLTVRNGGSLTLRLSFTVERILTMLNIIDYFLPEVVTEIDKKSA